MRFSLLSSVAALAACVAAAPALNNHVVHEKRDVLSAGWSKQKRALPEAYVPVRIGMTQRNLDKGHDLLMEVSMHDSPKYGKYYTEDEINELFAPAPEAVDALREWLESAGLARERVTQSYNKQWLQFDAKVNELEDLLKAKFHEYYDGNGRPHIACDEYSVPAHVSHHVDYITPGIKLMGVKKKRNVHAEAPLEKMKRDDAKFKVPLFMRPVNGVPASQATGNTAFCDSFVTPNCIRTMYNITQGTIDNPLQFGVYENLGERYNQTDLNLYFEQFYKRIPSGTHPQCDKVDGGTCLATSYATLGIGESELDVQISYPIIWPSNSVIYQVDDNLYEANNTYAGFLNNFFSAIDGSYCKPTPLDPPYPDPRPGGYHHPLQCGAYQPTKVISISYGEAEADLPIHYTRRSCGEIMKLGMRGVTTLVSSGDYGVAHPPGDVSLNGCLPINATQNGTIFTPDYPSNCPYITAVGSTFLPVGSKVGKDQEIATTRFGSGGGFSNIYKQPAYQKAAVQRYLTDYPPPYPFYRGYDNRNIGAGGGLYNIEGRAFPDVSAVGDNIVIVYQNFPTLIGGTSASSPTFGAILARINNERIAAGKATVGFVNPVLYAHPEVFHDITQGNNPGCGTPGFSASPGWDPVTGLGTPNYPALLALFMSLP